MRNKSMVKRTENNFTKRFGNRISVVYAEKPLKLKEKQTRNTVINAAIYKVFSAILKKEPSSKVMLGFENITKMQDK